MLETPVPPSREAIRAGFFFAFGAVLLLILALATRRFLDASLAVSLPFVIGLTLAFLLDPLADALERRGMKRAPASGLVFAGLLLLLVGLGILLVPMLATQASDFAHNAPGYVQNIQGYGNQFLKTHHKIGPVTLPPTFANLSDQISQYVGARLQALSGRTADILLGSVTFVIQMVLALILTFFLLLDIDRLRARLLFFVPDRNRALISTLGKDIGAVFSDYLAGLLKVCALYGLATILLLYALSIAHHALAHYALLVGVAAGILYAVPYLGSLSSALVTFLVTFAAAAPSGHGLSFAVTAILLTLVVNQVFDNIITPKVVGGGVGLHPVIALFALVIGGTLFGITGMLLSVPIAGSIQAILFRLYPKLSAPTPADFLHGEGIHGDDTPAPKTREGEDAVSLS